MLATRVLAVLFQIERHILFVYEYQLAYAACLEAGVVPIAEADRESLRWHGRYNTRLL